LKRIRTLHPLLALLLWLAAAYVVIGTGPMFIPAANSTVSGEAVLWKVFGATLLLAANFYLLKRSGIGAAALGLRPGGRTMGWLVAGSIAGMLIVVLWFGLFRAIAPIRFESGTMSAVQLAVSALVYMFGALLEELAFRGHALLLLRARYGSITAVAAVSLAFGILHLPGMEGMQAVKMVVLTGLSSVIFSLAYLRSGTLWTAVGLHMGMNLMLHSVLGGGGGQGPSLLTTVVGDGAPPGFDLAFWSFAAAALIVIAAMLLLRKRERVSALEPL
jgi:membrane protease YdiL (CAAX protease family)